MREAPSDGPGQSKNSFLGVDLKPANSTIRPRWDTGAYSRRGTAVGEQWVQGSGITLGAGALTRREADDQLRIWVKNHRTPA